MSEEVKKEENLSITIGDIRENVPYCVMEVIINDQELYEECCERARKEISKEALFEWWVNQALKNAVGKLPEEGPDGLEELEDYMKT